MFHQILDEATPMKQIEDKRLVDQRVDNQERGLQLDGSIARMLVAIQLRLVLRPDECLRGLTYLCIDYLGSMLAKATQTRYHLFHVLPGAHSALSFLLFRLFSSSSHRCLVSRLTCLLDLIRELLNLVLPVPRRLSEAGYASGRRAL